MIKNRVKILVLFMMLCQVLVMAETTSGKNVEFTAEEKAYLHKKGPIKMCVDPAWMPFEKISSDGKHVGMVSDILKIMTTRTGLRLELVPTRDWTHSLEFAEKRKCDILSLAMETPERLEYLDFTRPYIVFPYVIATKNSEIFVDRIESVLDKKMAMVKDYACVEILKSKYPGLDILEVKNIDEGLNAVRSGEAFAYIDSMAAIAYKIQNDGMLDLKIAGKLDFNWQLSIATRNDEPILNSIMQKAINTLTEKEKQEIYNSWFSIEYKNVIDNHLPWEVLSLVIILLVIVLFWNRQLSAAHKKNMTLIKELNEVQLELESKNKMLAKLAITDSLTQLNNRTKMDQLLETEFYRTERYNHPFGVILIDVDHFKIINDSFGHPVGDVVLKHFAKLLKEAIRKTDTIARWGGEEFMIVCPEATHDGILMLAEKLREKIEKFEFHRARNVTASFGVALSNNKDTGVKEIVARADKALYAAKESGRNKVKFM